MFTSDPELAGRSRGATRCRRRPPQIDLSTCVREELALAVPRYPLCRDDCAGLCPRCGADLNAGPCACARFRRTTSEDIMAVPKRRTSKSRKRLRRGPPHRAPAWPPRPVPAAARRKLPHRVCGSCGYYAGKKRIEVEDA